jgi:hypothetical protein
VTARGDLVRAALATLMIELGAIRAIGLDLNPEWPSCIAYGKRGGAAANKVVPYPQEPDRQLALRPRSAR